MANEWDAAERLEEWRELARVVRDEGLSELTVESGSIRLTLKAEPPPTPPGAFVPVAGVLPFPYAPGMPAAELAAPESPPATAPADATPAGDLVTVTSPMVGVFYRALSPDDPPLVAVGDHIEVGQPVGLVEAMKTFNDIASEVEGTVVEIRAGNSELVETGSILFVIKP